MQTHIFLATFDGPSPKSLEIFAVVYGVADFFCFYLHGSSTTQEDSEGDVSVLISVGGFVLKPLNFIVISFQDRQNTLNVFDVNNLVFYQTSHASICMRI